MILPKTLIVPPLDKPIRLDKFLITKFPGSSRNFWRQNLEGRVSVDGRPGKKSWLLKGGERLSFKEEEILRLKEPPADPGAPHSVVLVDPDFLVVEKPAGIPTHPLRVGETGTLLQGVLAHYPEVGKIGKDPREGGLVHRLDNETSGLLIVARNQEAYDFFREEFEKRRVEKEYAAVVVGKVKQGGRVDLPIAHHPKSKRRMIVVKNPPQMISGREAVTFFEVEKRGGDRSLLKVRIPTGVRHQIRVHLAQEGHPIVGDILYGGDSAAVPGLERILLHASSLSFRHPKTLKKVRVKSSIPDDWDSYLKS